VVVAGENALGLYVMTAGEVQLLGQVPAVIMAVLIIGFMKKTKNNCLLFCLRNYYR
jgi:hypothetical protein